MWNSLLDRIYIRREGKHLAIWREILLVYVLIFLVWGLYRMLFRMPVWFEELVLKGLVFGVPVFWVSIKKLGWKLKDLGMTGDNLASATYMGLVLGILLGLFGQLGNIVRYGGLRLSAFGLTSESIGAFLILSLVTAFWEELLFAGYILQRLGGAVKSEWTQLLVTASLFVLLHVPALILVQQMTIIEMVLVMVLLLILQIGSGVLMLRYRNLAAPVLAHALWGVTIFMFR